MGDLRVTPATLTPATRHARFGDLSCRSMDEWTVTLSPTLGQTLPCITLHARDLAPPPTFIQTPSRPTRPLLPQSFPRTTDNSSIPKWSLRTIDPTSPPILAIHETPPLLSLHMHPKHRGRRWLLLMLLGLPQRYILATRILSHSSILNRAERSRLSLYSLCSPLSISADVEGCRRFTLLFPSLSILLEAPISPLSNVPHLAPQVRLTRRVREQQGEHRRQPLFRLLLFSPQRPPFESSVFAASNAPGLIGFHELW
jgi:hypothetical protein